MHVLSVPKKRSREGRQILWLHLERQGIEVAIELTEQELGNLIFMSVLLFVSMWRPAVISTGECMVWSLGPSQLLEVVALTTPTGPSTYQCLTTVTIMSFHIVRLVLLAIHLKRKKAHISELPLSASVQVFEVSFLLSVPVAVHSRLGCGQIRTHRQLASANVASAHLGYSRIHLLIRRLLLAYSSRHLSRSSLSRISGLYPVRVRLAARVTPIIMYDVAVGS